MEKAKIAAAKKAASFIENGQIVGLGSGTTAHYFIEALAELVSQGLKIQAVASSRASEATAHLGHIPLLDLNSVSRIDITVDGADEIDSRKRMIKGGGGAHVREKILAAASKELIVIVDSSKLVPVLGTRPLPVEVIPYGASITRRHIEALGFFGDFRQIDSSYFITENGNVLFDIRFPSPPNHLEEIHQTLRSLPGVVDTGLFFNLAGRVIIGREDGTTEIV